MTLSKLSLRNAKRQAGDYLVYFFTVVMVAALIYAFNGLIFSAEVQSLSKQMAQVPMMIVLASIVVVCIISWLVSYTTNFMLTRRSREFGLYVLIGLENRQVARLFFWENLIVGGCALVLGIFLGNFLFQVLRAIIFTLFGTPYYFSFFFSVKAIGLTFIYFVLIYLFAQLKSRRRIRRMKICDLIYFDRQNEDAVIKTSSRRRKIFAASIIIGILGTFLLMMGGMLFGIIGAGCIIAFLYGFFLSFASGVPAFFDKYPARKYQNQNLLVFRMLTSKLAAMGIIMATIALLFTACIISEGTGMIFRSILQNRAKPNSCFDLILSANDGREETFKVCQNYILNNISVKDSRQYNIYRLDNNEMTDYVSANTGYYRVYDYDPVMGKSDYDALRDMLGYPPVTLKEGQYLIHCQPYVEKVLKNWNQAISFGGEEFTLKKICTEDFAQHLYENSGNGFGFIVVVPDNVAEACPVSHVMYTVLTKEQVSEEQYNALEQLLYNEWEHNGYDSTVFHSKAKEEADVAVTTAMMVFPLFYLALVLTMTAAVILTIQQLSETNHYKRQFELLRKLGMERREMSQALGYQFFIYYAMPAIPPVLIGVPFIVNLGGLVEPGIMVGESHPAVIAGISLGLFFLIYGVYILLAYTSLKRNVLPD